MEFAEKQSSKTTIKQNISMNRYRQLKIVLINAITIVGAVIKNEKLMTPTDDARVLHISLTALMNIENVWEINRFGRDFGCASIRMSNLFTELTAISHLSLFAKFSNR